MSRTGRLLVIAAAWTVPVVWIVGALLSGPSDGTLVSPATGLSPDARWGDTVTVVRSYGATPLETGDVVLAVDGRSPGAWLSGVSAQDREVGEIVQYQVRRAASDLDLDLEITINVPLTRYPLLAAARANLSTLTLIALLLVAASLVFWRRPEAAAARAFLATAALVPVVVTSSPFGVGAIDLAGSRGLRPHLAGEIAAAAGLGCALYAALTLTDKRPLRTGWAVAAAIAVPSLGYAIWALLVAGGSEVGAARIQGLITVAGPALVATAVAIAVALVAAFLAATERGDRLAARLVFLALVGGAAVRVLLGDLPEQVTGQPLVPWGVLNVVVAVPVLACVVAALLRHRLDEVEPTVRRALLQASVVALIGVLFLTGVGAVDLASDRSFESMLAGGVIALLVLPLALGVQRGVRRLLYGDRDLPRRVVSDLRRLDPTTSPEDALAESLTLLTRRLRLSYAAVEVVGSDRQEPIRTAVGQPRGTPVTVDLVVGGGMLGRLLLEVDPSRDPFGPGDRRMLEDVGAQVGALVQAVSMSGELQRSRQNLITAREEERRRLRRDLHDGLGPSLATLALHLETAKDLIAEDPEGAAELVGRLSDQARDEIDEVRRLVDGLRPPALDQLGLVTALRQSAEAHGQAARSRGRGPVMTWTVEADDEVEPLPAAVEVAAYRIAVEAVNNSMRHSDAETCTVTLSRDDGWLQVLVSDNGTGLATRPRVGVGLSSMRERAEELGGTCTVTSGAGSGTVVEARLPLGAIP